MRASSVQFGQATSCAWKSRGMQASLGLQNARARLELAQNGDFGLENDWRSATASAPGEVRAIKSQIRIEREWVGFS
jgi:hypothetical protein